MGTRGLGGRQMDPKEVQKEKALAAMEAELAMRRKMRAKNDDKAKMKGKNRQSKRHRKKQLNVVDDRRFKALVRANSGPWVVFFSRRSLDPVRKPLLLRTGRSVERLTRRAGGMSPCRQRRSGKATSRNAQGRAWRQREPWRR